MYMHVCPISHVAYPDYFLCIIREVETLDDVVRRVVISVCKDGDTQVWDVLKESCRDEFDVLSHSFDDADHR